MYTTLISPSELHAQLKSTVVIDCRFDLAKPEAGREAYAIGHIAGAQYAHLDLDLSASKSASTGRHPLPESNRLAATFGKWGINDRSQVVAYDADSGMFAARLWWLLRWLGHTHVAVLEGGYKAWQSAGLPISTEPATVTVQTFSARPQEGFFVTATEVEQLVKHSDWRVLDARAPERFRGDVEPIDPVAGHIPGARNHPFAWNLAA
jgi:thiosulfate/3-mercaptopyruvate sulfurtransferase